MGQKLLIITIFWEMLNYDYAAMVRTYYQYFCQHLLIVTSILQLNSNYQPATVMVTQGT